jgi:hypothetical protein
VERAGAQGLARAVLALLVAATVAAFFVTQRLKHSPTVVQNLQGYLLFSPGSSYGHTTVKFSFRIKRADDVTVTIVAPNGDDERTLARDHHLGAYTQWALRWDGRTDSGAQAPDGSYQIRVRLRDQGRSALLGRTITLDSAPPRPLITAIAPAAAPPGSTAAAGPAILPLPAGGPLRIDFTPDDGTRPGLAVYRTDVAPARLVTGLPVAPGATSVTWDGTVRGRSVGPGTYLVAIRDVDAAGNVGATPAGAGDRLHPGVTPPALAPAPAPGELVPGRAGITVRYLGVQPPVASVDQAAPLVFGVDARRAGYAWSVTRVGATRPREHGTGARALLRLPPPGGVSGVYELAVATRRRRTAVPFVVQGPGAQPVLVVLPAITWLGQDPVDDDGDGLPNTLDGGDPVRTDRVFAGAGLPAGFPDRIAPVLVFLDREGFRYDVTTDLALAGGRGPGLAGHVGVLLAGDERWLPAGVAARLRAFVRGGGKLASLGVDSLRRTVRLDGGVLRDASGPAATDAFGARIYGVGPATRPITDYLDRIGLFGGGAGQFAGYTSVEATQSVGPQAELVASAVTPDGRPVIAAVRIGRGLDIRTGLPQLGARLAGDPTTAALMKRIWALLSR